MMFPDVRGKFKRHSNNGKVHITKKLIPSESAQSISIVPGCVVDESEHGEGHGDEADGEVADGQVDDQQVAGCSGLRVTNHDPTDAHVGNHPDDHQETERRKQEIKHPWKT